MSSSYLPVALFSASCSFSPDSFYLDEALEAGEDRTLLDHTYCVY